MFSLFFLGCRELYRKELVLSTYVDYVTTGKSPGNQETLGPLGMAVPQESHNFSVFLFLSLSSSPPLLTCPLKILGQPPWCSTPTTYRNTDFEGKHLHLASSYQTLWDI